MVGKAENEACSHSLLFSNRILAFFFLKTGVHRGLLSGAWGVHDLVPPFLFLTQQPDPGCHHLSSALPVSPVVELQTAIDPFENNRVRCQLSSQICQSFLLASDPKLFSMSGGTLDIPSPSHSPSQRPLPRVSVSGPSCFLVPLSLLPSQDIGMAHSLSLLPYQNVLLTALCLIAPLPNSIPSHCVLYIIYLLASQHENINPTGQ